MSKKTQLIAKIAAVLAGLGLIAMTFAPALAKAQSTSSLEAQIQTLLAKVAVLQATLAGNASASVTFTRDLTIGSTGADVTALQNWLMSKGHTIAAGATGYFGAQTQAALAAYQASASISPAAGYFGPITRARVNAASIPAPLPSDDEDEEEVDDTDEDEEEEEEEDDDDRETSTSASVTVSDGADNDYATFVVTTELTAFGDDMYISRTGSAAFTYQIEDASDGSVVSTATATSSTVSSSADTEGSSYVIREGDAEEFTFTVTLDPSPADEGGSYRLQLLTVVFGDEEGENDDSWTARPVSDFETKSVYIAD